MKLQIKNKSIAPIEGFEIEGGLKMRCEQSTPNFSKILMSRKSCKDNRGASNTEIHQFIEYLEIFEIYRINNKK